MNFLFFILCLLTINRPVLAQMAFSVEKLQPGSATSAVALKLLGKPDIKSNVEELKQKEAWVYLNKNTHTTRLSLIFDKSTKKLEIVNWFVNKGDPESNIEYTKNKYKSATFEKHDAKWIVPDAGPEQAFLIDSNLGLKIAYNKYKNTVEAISWSKPLN